MIGFGKIGQNGRFWAKMAKFWSKKGQKVKFQIFPEEFFFRHFFKDQKVSFYGKNQQNPMNGFGEIGQNHRFWT